MAEEELKGSGGLGDVFASLEEIYAEEDAEEGVLDDEGVDSGGADSFFFDVDSDEAGGAGFDPGAQVGLARWKVDVVRGEDGKLLRGEEARENPATLVISRPWLDDPLADVDILLTPPVLARLSLALTELGKVYADPVPPKKRARSWFQRVLQWHTRHKFLAFFSVLFQLATLYFVVLGLARVLF